MSARKAVPEEEQMAEARFETTSATTEDPEKVSTGDAASESELQDIKATLKEERRILFKLDRVILPLTALLYLSAYLDRGNLGNAKLQGLFTGLLDSSDTKYSVVLCSEFQILSSGFWNKVLTDSWVDAVFYVT